jgi:hypothetical protein
VVSQYTTSARLVPHDGDGAHLYQLVIYLSLQLLSQYNWILEGLELR